MRSPKSSAAPWPRPAFISSRTPERSTVSNAARPACASFIHPATGHRPRAAHDPGLPRRGRARGGARATGGDRDGRPDAGRAARTGPVFLPTYANALGRAAMQAAIDLDHTGMWVGHLEAAVEAGVA